MTETTEIVQAEDTSFRKYFPFITATCCAISIVLFAGINMEGKMISWEIYKKWGAPSSLQIFEGSYWGLITSNFVHTEVWHIAFNLYWIWILGKKIEFESTRLYYILIILTSAFVSSVSQVVFSGSTGIGLSGIGYAFFGFIFIKSRFSPGYKNYLTQKTIRMFIVWFFVCIILTQLKAWNIGNAAHAGGLLWGMTLAYASTFERSKQWIIGFVFIATLTSSVFWYPYSTAWLSHKAYVLHDDQKFDEAIAIYKEILRRDPENEFAMENLKQLEGHELIEKAFQLHKDHKYKEARKVYEQILQKDPENEWAKENEKRLPNE
jgi:membrane associated rhomboid family serine protease